MWYFSPIFLSIPGSIRLQEGRSKLDGRVELYLGGVWGSICSDDWGDEDAAVACRQLGKGWGSTDTHTPQARITALLLPFTYIFWHRCKNNCHMKYTFTTQRDLTDDNSVMEFLLEMWENVITLESHSYMRSLHSLCTFLVWPLHSNPPLRSLEVFKYLKCSAIYLVASPLVSLLTRTHVQLSLVVLTRELRSC